MGEQVVWRERVAAPLQLNIVYISGDLVLEGSSTDELVISGDGAQVERVAEGQLRLECDTDCHVRVPRAVSVRVETVGGDLRATDLVSGLTVEQCHADLVVRTLSASLQIQSVAADARIAEVQGDVQIGAVGGDLTLRHINGAIYVEQVGADLDVKHVSGACAVRSVGADACLKDVRGALKIEQVSGDAVLTDVLENCTVDRIGSDLVLDVPFADGKRYQFGTIGADVLVKVRNGNAVILHLPSGAEKTINVRSVQLERGTKTDTIRVGECSEGCAEVTIKALGGDFELVGQSRVFSSTFEFSMPDNLGEIISSQISQQLSRLEQTLSQQSERMARRAEAVAGRTAERAKRDKQAWTWSGEVNVTAARRRTESSNVTEAERMAVLRMVEERKITIDEAERLLAALEGR